MNEVVRQMSGGRLAKAEGQTQPHTGITQTLAPDDSRARIEAEVLWYVLAMAREDRAKVAFSAVGRAGVTSADFEDAHHRFIFRAARKLHTVGEEITPAKITDKVEQGSPEAIDAVRSVLNDIDRVDPIDVDTFNHHLEFIARRTGQPEAVGPAPSAARPEPEPAGPVPNLAGPTPEPVGWAPPTICGIAGEDGGPCPPYEQEVGRVPSDTGENTVSATVDPIPTYELTQASRWAEYSERLDTAPKVIPIGNAFRLREAPLSNNPAHPFDKRATWSPLENLLSGGLHPGELLAIGGSAGIGKSTFALQLADSIAEGNLERKAAGGPLIPVLYVALELDGFELAKMSLSRLSCVHVGRIHSGRFRNNEADREAVERARRRYRENIAPFLTVMDVAHFGYESATVEAIRGEVRRMKTDFGSETVAVFVDPMHRMAADDSRFDNEEEARVVELCKELLALAKCEEVGVVLLIDAAFTAEEDMEEQDTTKVPGFREPYQLNHLVSTALFLEEGQELWDLFPKLYKGRTLKLDSFTGELTLNSFQDRLSERLKQAEKFRLFGTVGLRLIQSSTIKDYRQLYNSGYAVALCSKRRWEVSLSPIFHYHRAIKTFEELPV